jgi:hypothetical protein
MPGWKAWKARHPDRDRESNQRTARKYYVRHKRFVYEYLLTHPCVDCGEKDPVVLQFDHVRGVKLSTITNIRGSFERLKAEMEKCEVRCANCHLRRHTKENGWLRGVFS